MTDDRSRATGTQGGEVGLADGATPSGLPASWPTPREMAASFALPRSRSVTVGLLAGVEARKLAVDCSTLRDMGLGFSDRAAGIAGEALERAEALAVAVGRLERRCRSLERRCRVLREGLDGARIEAASGAFELTPAAVEELELARLDEFWGRTPA
jgi:hypothetical protein